MSPNPSRIRWNTPPQENPPQDGTQRNQQDQAPLPQQDNSRSSTPLLDQIGRDLTQLAREGKTKATFWQTERTEAAPAHPLTKAKE